MCSPERTAVFYLFLLVSGCGCLTSSASNLANLNGIFHDHAWAKRAEAVPFIYSVTYIFMLSIHWIFFSLTFIEGKGTAGMKTVAIRCVDFLSENFFFTLIRELYDYGIHFPISHLCLTFTGLLFSLWENKNITTGIVKTRNTIAQSWWKTGFVIQCTE